MVELHMLPNMLAAQNAGQKSFNRMFDRSVSPEDLLLLVQADAYGSLVSPDHYAPTAEFLREKLSVFHEQMASPPVTGAELIAAGFHPGKEFHEALEYAHRLQLAGVDHKNALPQVLAFLRRQHKE